ncbi:MAG: DNA-formamidopyrimidine glycosylase [Deltaproteobacteria bacterium]|jgi:formamidopyrimidine-DNA glycosylase
MPELPDVEIFKEYLDATALHQKIKEVEVRHQRILRNTSEEELKRELRGQSLESSRRHGKHLLVALSNSKWLAVHFGMSGSFSYYKDPDKEPPHARLLIAFENGYWLAYDSQRMLGGVELIADPEEYIRHHDLGPDAMDDNFDLAAFKKVLAGKNGQIKSALMDQQSLAGIGNIYSDEILFQAGIDPKRKVGDLDEMGAKNLYQAMKRVLQTTIGHRADPSQFPATYLTAHRRAGEKCPKCSGRIKSQKISGRTSYFCPSCQK